MIDKIDENKCSGCMMCSDVCFNNAISYKTDEYGFWYPEVDYSKCTQCGLCIDKCPAFHIEIQKEYKNPMVYAAWIKDVEMRRYSTSGGVYFAIAKAVLDSGGVIVACRFTDDWKHAEHVLVENEKQLMETVRSKYFQSNTMGIYKKIKTNLEKNKTVLFCGAPCQSVALQQFLGKKYNNLITMDFICRGINSQKAFEAFISELENRYHSKVSSIHLKNKRKGWTSLGVLINFENGEEYYETRSTSYWSLGYIRDNLYMRPVCHECQYRTIPRMSDFTIGDFWGITGAENEDMFNGISVLFINSERAKGLLNKYGKELILKEKSLEEAIQGNPCILYSPEKGKKRQQFFSFLKEMPFSEAVAKCCGKLGC